jgi:peroxiredoxin
MISIKTTTLILASLIAGASFAQTLPSFSLKQARGGQAWTEKSLAAKPTIVFLFSMGCPHNAKAAPDLSKLAKALEGKVRVIGVLNAEGDEASTYQESIGLKFPILCDPKMKLISAMNGKHSLDFFTLAGKGAKKATGFWEGYSKGWVETALKGIKANVPASKFSFLPTGRQSGCGF